MRAASMPAGPAADDGYFFRFGGRLKFLAFIPDLRVHGAPDPDQDTPHAHLVAADAGADILALIPVQFIGEVRVGEELAAEGDEIGLPFAQDLSRPFPA